MRNRLVHDFVEEDVPVLIAEIEPLVGFTESDEQ